MFLLPMSDMNTYHKKAFSDSLREEEEKNLHFQSKWYFKYVCSKSKFINIDLQTPLVKQ